MTWCCDKLILEQASVFFAYCSLPTAYFLIIMTNTCFLIMLHN